MSIASNQARNWFGLGGRTIALMLMLGAALGCDQSGSTSDAQFIAATGPDGAAKPDDSPVPAGPPATAAELARLPLVDAGARQASDTNVLLYLDGRGELQSGTAPPTKVLWWQIEGPPAQIADASAALKHCDGGDGVLVQDVDPDSVAASKGLAVGDTILEVNNQPVTSAAEFEEAISAVRDSDRNTALIKTERDGNVRFVGLPLDSED